MSVPATPSASRLARPVPYTPKRPLSSDDTANSSRTTTPSLLSNAKKFKAAISTESKSRLNVKSRPGSPTKGVYDGSRPKTPTSRPRTPNSARPKTPSTPKRGQVDGGFVSEMDVSRVDPEEALVDYSNVEPGDISGEIDESLLKDYGNDDKVLVSIR